MTREECLNALKDIIARGGNQEELFYWACGFQKEIKLLTDLIEEHFSNPPLKWEEIKEHDFVFDKDFNGLGGEWLKVYMKRITEYGDKVIMCGACGSGVCQTRSYKEDRFYRKEVQK